MVDAAQRARDLLIRSQHFQTSFYVIHTSDSRWGAYYCLSACVRNSPVTLLRKSRVNEAAGSNCVSAAVEQMILLNERVNHLISCLHHKGEIAGRFSGLNGF